MVKITLDACELEELFKNETPAGVYLRREVVSPYSGWTEVTVLGAGGLDTAFVKDNWGDSDLMQHAEEVTPS
jgi:hypothetical protein